MCGSLSASDGHLRCHTQRQHTCVYLHRESMSMDSRSHVSGVDIRGVGCPPGPQYGVNRRQASHGKWCTTTAVYARSLSPVFQILKSEVPVGLFHPQPSVLCPSHTRRREHSNFSKTSWGCCEATKRPQPMRNMPPVCAMSAGLTHRPRDPRLTTYIQAADWLTHCCCVGKRFTPCNDVLTRRCAAFGKQHLTTLTKLCTTEQQTAFRIRCHRIAA